MCEAVLVASITASATVLAAIVGAWAIVHAAKAGRPSRRARARRRD